MKNNSYCNQWEPVPAIKRRSGPVLFWAVACVLTFVPHLAASGDAPSWMHAVVSAPLPAHDEKTDAVLLYSETNVNVASTDKIKTVVRKAYKILRPSGREYGTALVSVNSNRKVTNLHGSCIP